MPELTPKMRQFQLWPGLRPRPCWWTYRPPSWWGGAACSSPRTSLNVGRRYSFSQAYALTIVANATQHLRLESSQHSM